MNATTKPAAGAEDKPNEDDNKTVAELNAEIFKLSASLVSAADETAENKILADIRSKKARIAKLNESRTKALDDIHTSVVMFGFKLADLHEPTRQILGAVAATAKAAGKAKGTREPMEPNIKSPKDASKTFIWTRNISDEAVKAALFADFKAGKSIAEYLVKPNEKASAARIVARLERETADTKDGKVTKSYAYSEANLKALSITRKDVEDAEEAYKKQVAAKAKK